MNNADPSQFDRTATSTVPGYNTLQELVALLAASETTPHRVLDLGCGTGAGLLALHRALPQATFVGCDIDATMIELTRSRCATFSSQLSLSVGGIDHIAQQPSFDVIVSTLVVHFLPPTERIAWLTSVRERLAPQGAFLCTALTRTGSERDKTWSKARATYAKQQGVAPEHFAQLQARMAANVSPVDENEFAEQLSKAGFGVPLPMLQFFAVRCWLVRPSSTESSRG